MGVELDLKVRFLSADSQENSVSLAVISVKIERKLGTPAGFPSPTIVIGDVMSKWLRGLTGNTVITKYGVSLFLATFLWFVS